ncbi:MAG: hypothetical protein IE932_14260 [Sphingopyxis terrae]|nr:hypothetical protein [Sphingopyxis terrae]
MTDDDVVELWGRRRDESWERYKKGVRIAMERIGKRSDARGTYTAFEIREPDGSRYTLWPR